MKKNYVLMVAFLVVISISSIAQVSSQKEVDDCKPTVKDKPVVKNKPVVVKNNADTIALSGKEYTVIASGDTILVKANGIDSIKVDFTAADSVELLWNEKARYQKIGGVVQKIFKLKANGKSFWAVEKDVVFNKDGTVSINSPAADTLSPAYTWLVLLFIGFSFIGTGVIIYFRRKKPTHKRV